MAIDMATAIPTLAELTASIREASRQVRDAQTLADVRIAQDHLMDLIDQLPGAASTADQPFEDRPQPDPGISREGFLADLEKAAQRVKPEESAADAGSDVAEEGEEHRP